jgi:uncharacterized Rmd1/YagE family protein
LVSNSVERKPGIIRDTCNALFEEASAGRDALVEIAVVVLIVLEILHALWRR